MKKIQRAIEWWNEGGNHYLGVDNDGEPMYSMTNGEMVLFAATCSLGMTGLIALIVFAKEVLTK